MKVVVPRNSVNQLMFGANWVEIALAAPISQFRETEGAVDMRGLAFIWASR